MLRRDANDGGHEVISYPLIEGLVGEYKLEHAAGYEFVEKATDIPFTGFIVWSLKAFVALSSDVNAFE